MSITIAIQSGSLHKTIPSTRQLKIWLQHVFAAERCQQAEVTLRIVNRRESAQLNTRYRHKAGATNVLTFVHDAECRWGDIVVCAPLIAWQARQQHKPVAAHWAHLLVHGALHLLGYDHQTAAQAKIMEKREIRLLDSWGFANPYLASARDYLEND